MTKAELIVGLAAGAEVLSGRHSNSWEKSSSLLVFLAKVRWQPFVFNAWSVSTVA